MDGIDLIVSNNFQSDCVFPSQCSPPPESDKCLEDFPEVFTACVVARAMARTWVEKPSEASRSKSRGARTLSCHLEVFVTCLLCRAEKRMG